MSTGYHSVILLNTTVGYSLRVAMVVDLVVVVSLLIQEEHGIRSMAYNVCHTLQIISEVLSEILSVEKCNFAKPMIS